MRRGEEFLDFMGVRFSIFLRVFEELMEEELSEEDFLRGGECDLILIEQRVQGGVYDFEILGFLNILSGGDKFLDEGARI